MTNIRTEKHIMLSMRDGVQLEGSTLTLGMWFFHLSFSERLGEHSCLFRNSVFKLSLAGEAGNG